MHVILSPSALDIHDIEESTWMMDPAESEMNILSNGKSHDLRDDADVPMKTFLDEDQWVFSLYF